MNKTKLGRGCAIAILLLAALGAMFYAIAHDQLRYRQNITQSITASNNVGELLAGETVEQVITTPDERLDAISIMFLTLGRTNTGSLEVAVQDGSKTLYRTTVDVSKLRDYEFYALPIEPAISDIAGKALTLRITSVDGAKGNAVSVFYGNSVNTGRIELTADIPYPIYYNGKALDGQLCTELTTTENLWFGAYYWCFYVGVLLAVTAYCIYLIRCNSRGKTCVGLRLIVAVTRYRFLIQQLVNRDFKTKYKRSVLGVVWSFLNPLLTMLVQYVVFSTIFRSSIPNYPLYLLSGIVCFSFFSESVGMSMTSITGNASLITKVYIPKYIFPLSRTISSGINLLLSLIPLLIMMLVTGQRFTPAIFLLPIGLLFLFMFCIGMGLLLSAAMVFFRDTQFIWNVLSMIWMYATPIFYPESIIPAQWMTLYKLNPMYHIIRIFRIILINGVSPEPKAYGLCFLAAAIPLLIGTWVFKRTQDRFILHV